MFKQKMEAKKTLGKSIKFFVEQNIKKIPLVLWGIYLPPGYLFYGITEGGASYYTLSPKMTKNWNICSFFIKFYLQVARPNAKDRRYLLSEVATLLL